MSVKLKSLVLVLLLLPLLIYEILNYFQLPDTSAEPVGTEIIIPRGASLTRIADSLKSHGLIEQKSLFIFWAKSLGYEASLKSGLYLVPDKLNYPQLCTFLATTKPEDINVRLIEGWSTRRILEEISWRLNLDFHALDTLSRDAGFCAQLGIEGDDLSGYLLPDTYSFPLGISAQEVLRYLVRQTLQIFSADSVNAQLKSRGLSRRQIIIMASIIEGEAMLDKERATIASVYWNRIKRGIRLQADPTIQFLLGGKPRRLLYKDLKIDSPYNTYKYKGLPPGPINNPGKSSIYAAIFPAKTDYIFFVARGDGSHVFSRTAREHAAAKAAFNKVRREVARQKRYKRGT